MGPPLFHLFDLRIDIWMASIINIKQQAVTATSSDEPSVVCFLLTPRHIEVLLLPQFSLNDHFLLEVFLRLASWLLSLAPGPLHSDHPYQYPGSSDEIQMVLHLTATFIYKNKGWKFLKKLWCCVGGGNKVIWLYQLSWKCKLATVMSYKVDVSSVSPSSESPG